MHDMGKGRTVRITIEVEGTPIECKVAVGLVSVLGLLQADESHHRWLGSDLYDFATGLAFVLDDMLQSEHQEACEQLGRELDNNHLARKLKELAALLERGRRA